LHVANNKGHFKFIYSTYSYADNCSRVNVGINPHFTIHDSSDNNNENNYDKRI
jgi:hypothetical protein